MTELKKCPFCGSTGPQRITDNNELFWVRCKFSSCTASYTRAFHSDKEAIEAWNRRVGEK